MPTPYLTSTGVPAGRDRGCAGKCGVPGVGIGVRRCATSEKSARLGSLLRGCNVARGVVAALIGCVVVGGAGGQTPVGDGSGAVPEVDAAALVPPAFEPPSPSACIDAFNLVSTWVRAWAVPEREAGAPVSDPEGTYAVCVTLRLSGATGRLLSRSVVVVDDANKGEVLRLATKAALIEAEPKLKLENDATRQARLLETAARVMVDVQIGGRQVPLAGETLDEIALRLNPGRDGVLARGVGDGAGGAGGAPGAGAGAVFPASMLSMNVSPGKACEIAVGMLGLPPLPLKELREKSGLEVYRFASRQVAQTEPGGPAVILFRGGRVVPLQEMNGQGLRDFGSAMSDHIRSHMFRGSGPDAVPLGLRGSYNPLTDTYSPPVATPREQAVAALALARWSRVGGVPAEGASKALETAREVLDQLTRVDPRETDPLASVTGAAAWVLADFEISRSHPADADSARSQRIAEFRTRALGVLRAAVSVNGENEGADVGAGGTAGQQVVWSPGIAALERPLVACALARSADSDSVRAVAQAVVRSLLREAPAGELVASMPWLGWAEMALVSADPAAPVPSAEALRQMRALCWSRQVTPEACADDPDMAGGIVFTSGASAGITAGFPTWQSLRPLAFLATMLGDARLTGEEELQREVLSLVRTLRFARQLAVDQDVGHMMRDPSRALGGVRPALWDQTASLDATSMALLTVAEALTSADVRTK